MHVIITPDKQAAGLAMICLCGGVRLW